MSNEKVNAVRLKLAEIARDALLKQMGWPSNAQWWFRGADVGQDRDGYFVLAKIHPKLPLDSTGWPYGLPHDSNGVQVRSSREDQDWHPPGRIV